MEEDYYKLLGISKGADEKEINKAYRKLATKWHPDKNPDNAEEATKMFKKLTEAKDILTNPEKREIYDKFGKEGLDRAGKEGQNDEAMNEFMKNMFNQQKLSVPDIQIQETFTYEELYKGKEYIKTIERTVNCDKCDGNGTADALPHDCTTCGGSGVIEQMIRQGPMIQQIRRPCNKCHGSGTDGLSEKCSKCMGRKSMQSPSNVKITIPAGAFSGTSIRIQNEGNDIPYDERIGSVRYRTDLIVHVDEKPHSQYKRGIYGDPADLFLRLEVSLAESLVGFNKEISLLNGQKIILTSDKILRHGDKMVVPGKGFPRIKDVQPNDMVGNLIVDISVRMPEEVISQNKKKIVELLGGIDRYEPKGTKVPLETVDVHRKYKFAGPPDPFSTNFKHQQRMHNSNQQQQECKVQ